ncbi:hypothetical protein DICPUDRAFT_149339 [Dictyostelium purpureum]|uniref:FNIP repeat-containing protein n=1 Tax=Dictyostelium purpureum TaxID=5786 RepID=F0ZDF9_DICPU|nr:uncharacterized protein DICPUDRAFT_149339 [Dictyostelium purpureum]EGC38057.1 hypothetical protein DICPUDRAFT_149339 [Dictyostelium purpureum]|eukprot:XP_003285458.1 hypothetical protein DICPUDRAFT_149339 [Dictyostelium purpureum]
MYNIDHNINNKNDNIDNYINNINNININNNNNNKNNNNNNNTESYNEKNSILFYKIWRFIFLKKKILFFVKLFNIHYHKRSYYKFIGDSNYKFIDYLRSIELNLKSVEEPWNLKKLGLPPNTEEVDMGIGGDFRNQPPGKHLKIPKNLKIKTFKFPYRYQGKVKAEFITPHLETLILSYSFNQPLHELFNSTNSRNLVSLNLGCDFDSPIQEGVLPVNLKYLKLSDRFNHRLIAGALPQSLESIVFGNDFNQPLLPLDLPSNLVSIQFGNCFDQPLYFINDSKKIVPILPQQRLKSLVIGTSFSQSIEEGCLPTTLETLSISNRFMTGYKKKLKFFPSPNLTKLSISAAYLGDFKYPKSINPPRLLKVKISNKHSKNVDLSQVLPSSVTHLTLENSNFVIKKNSLPNSLKKLKVSKSVSFEPNSIPSSVTEINGCHPDFISKVAPSSISKYTLPALSNDFVISNPQSIPSNIDYLKVDNISIFGISFYSMNFIKTLILEPAFDFDVAIKPNVLPPTLVNLSFNYAKKIEPQVLPNSIELLEVGSHFNQDISTEWLPLSLQSFIIKGKGTIISLPDTISGIYTFSGNHLFLDKLNLTEDLISILYF